MKFHIPIKCSLIVCLLVNSCPLFSTENIPVAEVISPNSSVSFTKTPNKGIDIKKVMDYQMPDIIARYRKDYKVSEDVAKIHEVELKRYLILAGDTDDGSSLGMMSTEVDNLWHTFLLFTKDYQIFCNEMFDKFIHHCPKTDKEA
jgi:hypothetical protein